MKPSDRRLTPRALSCASSCLMLAVCVFLPMKNTFADDGGRLRNGASKPLQPFPVQPSSGGAAASHEATAGILELTVSDAVLMALENNVAFQIDRLRPAIRRTGEEIERATFDPRLSAGAYYEDTTGGTETDGLSAEVGVGRFFSVGTTAQARVGFTDSSGTPLDTEFGSWDVEVTQALLRGRGSAVNLARLRQARIDTHISQYELHGVAEALVAAIEKTYWDCVLAQEKINIYAKSLEVAEQQIAEVRAQIAIGKVAEIELAAAEAELADKREELITARGDLAKKLLVFRHLLNPGGGQRTRELRFRDSPQASNMRLDDVEAHVKLGTARRPDLEQARLQVDKGELEIVRTRNGLLPQLDFFARLGGTHYSGALAEDDEDDEYQVAVGLVLAFPVGLREEKARYRQAQLTLEQTELALTNMEQLIQLDVRTAYVEVETASEQIAATGATRKLRQDTSTAEREKFRVGISTTLQVAQAWRDLLASQINEIQAVINHRKALIDLYRLEGTLLERRGIQTPAGDAKR